MICPHGCGELLKGERLFVCGWCGASEPRVREDATPLPPETVRVPAGVFILGSADGVAAAQPSERPERRIHLSDYRIGHAPVANGEYRAFVEATGAREPDHWAERPPFGSNARHPVCFVTWHEARAYCAWAALEFARPYRLPSEAEWEKAARGGLWLDGDHEAKRRNPSPARLFPHGDAEPGRNEANIAGLVGGTSEAGRFAATSPYGCVDLSGNVSEWCEDTFGADAYASLPNRDPVHRDGALRVLRGGSWRSESAHARCSNRYFYDPSRRNYGIGFRVAEDA